MGDCAGMPLTGSRQAGGAFQQPGVHEGLGQVAAQLALANVVFLGVKARRSACRAVALEPACRLGVERVRARW